MDMNDLQDVAETPALPTVNINGRVTTLAEPTLDALRGALRTAGVVTFAAIVDGVEESDPSRLVTALEAGEPIEIRTYAKPGSR